MRQHPIRSTGRKASRSLALLALVPTFGLVLATAAYADVTTVTGSATGVSATLTLLGGVSANVPPQPVVTLPPGGTDSLASVNARVLRTGVLNVSTQGTLGAGGSVTSSANVANPAVGLPILAPNILAATAVGSTCTSNEAGSSGTATIANLTVAGSPVAVSTAPNTTLNIAGVGILHVNEQIPSGTGASTGITVNALRLEVNAGPLGQGSIIIAQSVCGVVGTQVVVPTGAIGGVLLTALVAVAFGVYQLRRGRRRGVSAI